MKNKLVILFLLLSCSGASADVFSHPEQIKNVTGKLPKPKNIACKFTQEKTLPNKVVLKSHGDFTFDKEKGVIFYTTYPVKSTSSYTNKEYNQINGIIKGIAENNYKKLEREFNFYFEEKGGVFNLGFKPKETSRAYNYINSVEITGKEDISKLIIITTDKTKTVINFIK